MHMVKGIIDSIFQSFQLHLNSTYIIYYEDSLPINLESC